MLVTIVENIFATIFNKPSKLLAEYVLHLNNFLLELPEAGLSNEVLADIKNKYKEKFGKHIS